MDHLTIAVSQTTGESDTKFTENRPNIVFAEGDYIDDHSKDEQFAYSNIKTPNIYYVNGFVGSSYSCKLNLMWKQKYSI